MFFASQVTGTSLHSTKEALRLTRLYPGTLYSTAGLQRMWAPGKKIYLSFIQESILTMQNPGMR